MKGINPNLRLNKKGGEEKPSSGFALGGQTVNQEVELCDAPQEADDSNVIGMLREDEGEPPASA